MIAPPRKLEYLSPVLCRAVAPVRSQIHGIHSAPTTLKHAIGWHSNAMRESVIRQQGHSLRHAPLKAEQESVITGRPPVIQLAYARIVSALHRIFERNYKARR